MATVPTSERYRIVPRPYPVDDLARAVGLDPDDRCLTSKLMLRLGFAATTRRWVVRCRRFGLTAVAADHWATRAGLHPDHVWPDWMPVDLDDDWYGDDPDLDDLDSAPRPPRQGARMITYLARVIRHEVEGEPIDVHLQLIRDEEHVEVNDGDEFVTVDLTVDPFQQPA